MYMTRMADGEALIKSGAVDAVTIGYKNTAEIDEAIENLNLALA